MNISLIEDIKTMAEFQSEPDKLAAQVHETGRPIVVTKNGKPDLVLMDAAAYERKLKSANLAEMLAEAEADINAGRTQPYGKFMKEFRRAKKISS